MITYYSSVSELRALTTYDWTHSRNRNRVNQVMDRDGKEWLGLPSARACIQALTDGYPAGADKIQSAINELSNLPKAIGIGRVLVRGMMGDELDIHAVNRGDLGNAFTSRKRLLKKAVANIRVVIDICGNCDVDSDKLLWRGVAGLALANIMTKAKYKTEIIGAIGVRNHYDGAEVDVIGITVKSFGITADNNLLASTVCLAGFFRTLGFIAIIKQAEDAGENIASSIGQSINIESYYPVDNKCTQIIVPESIYSKYSAIKWLNETIDLIQGSK